MVDADALPRLVSDMAKLRDGLLPLIWRQMAISQVPVQSIQISLKRSPEGDWEDNWDKARNLATYILGRIS
jgi:hypothetical protein